MGDSLQVMPRELELRPPIPTDESLRPIAEANRKGHVARLKERKRFQPRAVREGDWLPYIKAAMLQRQHVFQGGKDKGVLNREQPALQQGQPGTMGILPLHVREHLAVLERCTRNFSDALALVLSAHLPAQQTDKTMQDKEAGLCQRTEEDEQRHRADWADRHRLLSIFESMKEIAADQAAERRATEEHACRIIQRAWRSTAALRRSRPGGVHLPRTPDNRPSRAPRSARLRGWLRGASSTNTGFGRSVDDRGPNLTFSRNSRPSGSRLASRRITQTDGTLLPEPLREAASTATLAAMALAANTSQLGRHSGGFYKSMMAAAGQVSRAKRAAAVHTPDQAPPPGSSHDEQAEAAGSKAAAEVLAAGGSDNDAQEARRVAMQRVINAYHAGAAATGAAAAEVAAAAAAASEAGIGPAAPFDPEAAYAAAMTKYLNARAPLPSSNTSPPKGGGGSHEITAAGTKESSGGRVRQGGLNGEGQRPSLMPDIGQGAGAWADEDGDGLHASRERTSIGNCRMGAGGKSGDATAANRDGNAGVGRRDLRQSSSAKEENGTAARDVEGSGGGAGAGADADGDEGAEGTKKVKRTKSLRWCAEPLQLGPKSSEEPRRLGSCQGSAADSNSSRHPSEAASKGDSAASMEEGRSTAVGSVSVAGGGGSRATSRGGASTGDDTLGTNVSVWSLHPQHSAHAGGDRRASGTRQSAGGHRVEGANGDEGDSALMGYAPNSPRSLRSARDSKGSHSSKGSRGGRGLLHCSGSSSDSDLTSSSHFSFKMREKLQALDADRTPHADQGGGSGSGINGQRARAAAYVHASTAGSWAAGASPLGRSSCPEMPSIPACAAAPAIRAGDVQDGNKGTRPGHESAAEATAKVPVGSSVSPFATSPSPFAAGATSVGCLSAAASPRSSDQPHSSMASAAAAAVAAVDAEHAAAAAGAMGGSHGASSAWRSKPGSSSGATARSASRMGLSTGGQKVAKLTLNGGLDGGDGGVRDVGLGVHPRLLVSTGREAWGSGEASPQGSVERQACLYAANPEAAAALLRQGEWCGGEEVQYGPVEVSPLPSPKLCATPMPANGVVGVGPRPPFRGADMSSYQIQRAYEIEASRASVPEMLLRAHRQDVSGGYSSSSSSIRSPSSYAMANAIQAQIDALELRDAQQQQQQQQQQLIQGGRLEGGSRLLRRASHGGCSTGSAAAEQQRSGSDTLVGLDGQQQVRHQQTQQVHARRASEVGAGVVEAVEVDAQLRAHAHVYARARSMSYEDALEAVISRSRRPSHANSQRTGSRVCSRNTSSTSKPQDGGVKQGEEEDEREEDEEKKQREEARHNAASAAAAAKAAPAPEHGENGGSVEEGGAWGACPNSARKPPHPSKRVSFVGEGSVEVVEGERQRKVGGGTPVLAQSAAGLWRNGSAELVGGVTPPTRASQPTPPYGALPPDAAHGSAQRPQGCRRRMSSLAASLDSALKEAAAAQLQREQQQLFSTNCTPSKGGQPGPRGAGRLHVGGVAAQQNWHAHKQGLPPTLPLSSYSKPPPTPIYGAMIHSSPSQPQRPTLLWQDDPNISSLLHRTTPPQSPPPPLPPRTSQRNSLPPTPNHTCPCPPSPLPTPSPVTILTTQQALPGPASASAAHGLPLAVMDPVAASIEARELAAARTHAWALEHAPNVVGGGLDNVRDDGVDPAGCAAIANAADTHSCGLEDVERHTGSTGAAGAAAAVGGCDAFAALDHQRGEGCKAGMVTHTEGLSPSPRAVGPLASEATASFAAASAGSALLPTHGPAPPTAAWSPHTQTPPLPSQSVAAKRQSPPPPHAHKAAGAAWVGGQHSPLPQQSPTLAPLAPRQMVWKGQEGCDMVLAPATPPAQKCLGGGLQGVLEQQHQYQHQPNLHQLQHLSQQQQQRPQQHPHQQRAQRLQQHQQHIRTRQQQQHQQHQQHQQQLQPRGGSAPLPVSSISPFTETTPPSPDPHTLSRAHAPPCTQLDLECVGKPPQGFRRPLSPMGQRHPLSPKSLQFMQGAAVDGALTGERVSPTDIADASVSLSSPPEECSSSSSSIRAGDGAQALPPIDKGNAFSRYLRAKREEHRGGRAA